MAENVKAIVRWEQQDARGPECVRATEGRRVRARHKHWPDSTSQSGGGPLLVELDGQVVGLAYFEAPWPPFAEVQNMQVIPAFRRRGAGSAILDHCVEQARRRGFMAMFLQTDNDNIQAQRLYARKGFVAATQGRMLRLVRLLDYPILDEFLHLRPLATYRGGDQSQGGSCPLLWHDPVNGDSLRLTLTGGSSDKDSDGYGPGLSAIECSLAGRCFAAELVGPGAIEPGKPLQLLLSMTNRSAAPMDASARLLLPGGCRPVGAWPRFGPEVALASGQQQQVVFEVEVTDQLDTARLERASFMSVPLTVEVFTSSSSFWLAHAVMLGAGGPKE